MYGEPGAERAVDADWADDGCDVADGAGARWEYFICRERDGDEFAECVGPVDFGEWGEYGDVGDNDKRGDGDGYDEWEWEWAEFGGGEGEGIECGGCAGGCGGCGWTRTYFVIGFY